MEFLQCPAPAVPTLLQALQDSQTLPTSFYCIWLSTGPKSLPSAVVWISLHAAHFVTDLDAGKEPAFITEPTHTSNLFQYVSGCDQPDQRAQCRNWYAQKIQLAVVHESTP